MESLDLSEIELLLSELKLGKIDFEKLNFKLMSFDECKEWVNFLLQDFNKQLNQKLKHRIDRRNALGGFFTLIFGLTAIIAPPTLMRLSPNTPINPLNFIFTFFGFILMLLGYMAMHHAFEGDLL